MCIIPTANPRTAPTTVTQGLVPHHRSSPAPASGGNANSNPMVEIRDAHSIPTDKLERRSGGGTYYSRSPGDREGRRARIPPRETQTGNSRLSGGFTEARPLDEDPLY